MNHRILNVVATSAVLLSGCAAYLKPAIKPGIKTAKVADGTYEGKAEAYAVDGEMNLSVTFQDNKIISIKTINSGSTASIYRAIEERLFPRIINSQSINIDDITGATISSISAKYIIQNIINENGGNADEWKMESPKSTDVVKKDGYDVIVVGLGSSGISSYLSAASNGATVFGMDSAAKIGGNGAMSAGAMAVNPQTQVALNDGNPFVNEEDMIEDWLSYTDGDAKEEIIRKIVQESGKTLDWLQTNYDFHFGEKMFAFYHPKLWPLWTTYTDKSGTDKDTAYINSMNQATALNSKNEYMTELTAKELLKDTDGKVVGVKAVSYDGTTYEIYGKSVILATGGFLGNEEMCQKYTGSVWQTYGMTQCNGAGIQMAEASGGVVMNPDAGVETHIAQIANIIRSDDVSADDKAILTSLLLDTNAVMVDSSGNPFNEQAGNNLSFNAWLAGKEFYTIYNAEEITKMKTSGISSFYKPTFLSQGGSYEVNTPIPNIENILAIGEKYDDVITAESISELGNKLGFKLLISDVHGKTTGKFYAIKGAAYIYSTTGGLDVDENFNVLTKEHEPISNVYAVGNDSMGVLFASKKAYITYGGVAQGYALTSGRLAGYYASANTK